MAARPFQISALGVNIPAAKHTSGKDQVRPSHSSEIDLPGIEIWIALLLRMKCLNCTPLISGSNTRVLELDSWQCSLYRFELSYSEFYFHLNSKTSITTNLSKPLKMSEPHSLTHYHNDGISASYTVILCKQRRAK